MKGLVITTDSLMRTEEYTTPLHESIGKTVGGWIEVVHPKLLPAPYCMIVNEEGLLLGLPVNLLGSILYESFRHGNPLSAISCSAKRALSRASATSSVWTMTTSNASVR